MSQTFPSVNWDKIEPNKWYLIKIYNVWAICEILIMQRDTIKCDILIDDAIRFRAYPKQYITFCTNIPSLYDAGEVN